MYGAASGGNDGINLSGGYFRSNWKGMGKRGAITLRNFALAVKQIEAQCEISIPRVYSGDYYKRIAYHEDLKNGARQGFYFHGDIQGNRSDPGWDANDISAFFRLLSSLDNPIRKPECEVPPSLKRELCEAAL